MKHVLKRFLFCVAVALLFSFVGSLAYADHSWGGEQGLVDTVAVVTVEDHGWGGEKDEDPWDTDDGGWDEPHMKVLPDEGGWNDINSYGRWLLCSICFWIF